MNSSADSNWLDLIFQQLAHVSVWGGLIVAAAWGICGAFPSIPPGIRVALWRLVCLKLLILLAWPTELRLPVANETEGAVAWNWVARTRIPSNQAGIPEAVQSPSGQATNSRQVLLKLSARNWVTLIWMAGFCFSLLRFVRSWIETMKALKEGNQNSDPSLETAFASLSRHLGLTRAPKLFLHPRITGPLVAGFNSPVVMLPFSVLNQFSAAELRQILAHELAHVAKNDCAWNWVRRALGTVLFFHPLVWIFLDQAALADELACDEKSIRANECGPRDYAQTLIRVTELGSMLRESDSARIGAAMSRSARWMTSRLESLAAMEHVRDGAASIRKWITWPAAIILIFMILAAGWIQFFPPNGIEQIDTNYRVAGIRMSRGGSHTMTLETEVFSLGGIQIARSTMKAEPATTSGRDQLPSRIASTLQSVGLKPTLKKRTSSMGFSESPDSIAFFVRFDRAESDDNIARIQAELMDPKGDTAPLQLFSIGKGSSPGETIVAWTMPGPTQTQADERFRMILRLDGRLIARIKLGKLPVLPSQTHQTPAR